MNISNLDLTIRLKETEACIRYIASAVHYAKTIDNPEISRDILGSLTGAMLRVLEDVRKARGWLEFSASEGEEFFDEELFDKLLNAEESVKSL